MKRINRHNYEAFYIDYLDGNLTQEETAEMEAFLKANPDLSEELEGLGEISLSPESSSIDKSGLKVPNLDLLKQDQEQRDILFYKAVEGDATPQELDALRVLIQQEKFAEEYEQWKMAVLKPMETEKVSGRNLHRLPLELPVTPSNFESFLIARSEGILSEEQRRAVEEYAQNSRIAKRESELYDNLRLKAPAGIFYPEKAKLKKTNTRIYFLRAASVIIILTFLGSLAFLLQENEPLVANVENNTSDSSKTEVPATKIDSAKDKKMMKMPLQEWELHEPDPVEYAELKDNKPEFKKREGKAERNEREILPIEPLTADVKLRPIETERPTYPETEIESPGSEDEFLTIAEIAEERLANELNISDEGRDELALAIAKKLTEKTGELLDTEIKKSENESSDYLTYSVRIGSFKVSHKTRK